MPLKKTVLSGLAILLSTIAPGAVGASPVNLVQNGNFETTTNGPNYQLRSGYTQLANWTVDTTMNDGGLSFVVSQGWTGAIAPQGGHKGAWGQYGQFNVWSPNTGETNGFVDSPAGGNYIVADGAASYHAAISQTISGLTVGDQYDVSFWWASGQQSGFDGPTHDKGWDVTFGGTTQKTARNADVNHGFTKWVQTTMTFTATSGSQLLSFLAQGEPNNVPPLVFLDGVSVTASVPEPSTLVMMGLGAAGLGLFRFRHRRAG